ncbi:nuclear valosin-containing protein-like [Watersipora subatra]|uniref:nuclear valosin-containing protein-like n=1 Tax=Watersipora subatra TaxID=2589382 RepID=UPI00355C2687
MRYLTDARLVPRVRNYLERKSSADGVDANTIVTYLQKIHPEYRRKKRANLVHSVEKALDIILEDFSSCSSSGEEDVDILSARRPKRQKQGEEVNVIDSEQSFSGDAAYAGLKDSNSVNSLVTSLYSKTVSPAVPQPARYEQKRAGFLRCQSDPALNELHQLSNLGYIDRGPNTPLNHSKLIESLPASPLPDLDGSSAGNSSDPEPIVITIGDDEESIHIVPHQTSQGPEPGKIVTKPQPVNSIRKATEGTTPSIFLSKVKPTATPKAKSSSSNLKEKPSASTPKQKPPSTSSKKKGAIDAVISTTKFSQIGGSEETIEEVQKLLLHMRYPEVYHQIGVMPPRGFLLHGPPGCGKTLMAHAIAGELELPFIKLAATELVAGVSGESEERVRNLFQQATANAPCVLFIDEVDSITPKRETASKDMEKRIVSQFLTCLDDLCEKKDAQVLVIGATNRPDSLDPALRRAGRFDREISMGIPDSKARESILRVLCKDIRLVEGFDYAMISHLTPGYVGADLSSLVREAAMLAVNEVFAELQGKAKSDSTQREEQSVPMELGNEPCSEKLDLTSDSKEQALTVEEVSKSQPASLVDSVKSSSLPQAGTGSNEESIWKKPPPLSPEKLKSLHISTNHFLEAVKIVQPSAKREGFATVPGVTWENVGALKSIREELQMAILAPVKYPEQFKSLGLSAPAGVLLAGPPGCGKTLLAKAIANESGINFISVKGPELINMYVGESEKAVRQVFQRARNSSPCVVFFDELDSLCPRRSLNKTDGGSGSRIVNQLLTEMDGLQERKQVFVMGATNRPDIIDPAVLRPGRLDKTLHVGLPTLDDRTDILKTITKNCTKPFIEGVDLAVLAARKECDGFSGADLTAVVREASMAAMKDYISQEAAGATSSPAAIVLRQEHFDIALSKLKPSISAKDRLHYEISASK